MYFLPKYRRGYYNKYRKGMPVVEMLIKDIRHFLIRYKNFFANGFRHKNVLFYPHYPSSKSALKKAFGLLNINVTNKIDTPVCCAVYWEYDTYRVEYQALEALADKGISVINLYSRDISKEYVETAFEEVFGYTTFVDPTSYSGACVKKSTINALHDGEIVQCPIDKPEEGFIYQKIIDNSKDDKFVEDIRIPILAGHMATIQLKSRLLEKRFTAIQKTVLVKKETVLSEEEIKKVLEYCKHIRLDYGELDILRDNQDGRIYIIDVNNTPRGGPPEQTSKADGKRVLKELAKMLKESLKEI